MHGIWKDRGLGRKNTCGCWLHATGEEKKMRTTRSNGAGPSNVSRNYSEMKTKGRSWEHAVINVLLGLCNF